MATYLILSYSGSQCNDFVDYSLSHHPHSGGIDVNYVPVRVRHPVNGGIGVDNGHILDIPYPGSQWNDVVDCSLSHHPHSGGIGVNYGPFHARHPVNGGIGVDNGHIDGSQWSNGADYSLSHSPPSATPHIVTVGSCLFYGHHTASHSNAFGGICDHVLCHEMAASTQPHDQTQQHGIIQFVGHNPGLE